MKLLPKRNRVFFLLFGERSNQIGWYQKILGNTSEEKFKVFRIIVSFSGNLCSKRHSTWNLICWWLFFLVQKISWSGFSLLKICEKFFELRWFFLFVEKYGFHLNFFLKRHPQFTECLIKFFEHLLFKMALKQQLIKFLCVGKLNLTLKLEICNFVVLKLKIL